jgi:hypothetical protein
LDTRLAGGLLEVVDLAAGLVDVVAAVLKVIVGVDVLPKLVVEEADLCKVAVEVLVVVGRLGLDEFATGVVEAEDERDFGFSGKGRVLYLLFTFVPVGTRHEPDERLEILAGLVVGVLVISIMPSVVPLSVVVEVRGDPAASSGRVDDRVIDTLLASFSASFDELRDEEEDILGTLAIGVGLVETLDADLDDRVDLGTVFVTPLSSPSALDFFRLFYIKSN